MYCAEADLGYKVCEYKNEFARTGLTLHSSELLSVGTIVSSYKLWKLLEIEQVPQQACLGPTSLTCF